MCIIIDTNVLKSVFDKDNQNHKDFIDVYNWIFLGKGKVIYGGTKYLREITKYATLFTELKKIGKAVLIPANLVDEDEITLTNMLIHPDFDDQHLVALLRTSKCKIICSRDSRAYPYFRHSMFFTTANNKPKIYSGIRNKSLLCDKNICQSCKPSSTTNNKQKEILNILMNSY